MAKDNEIAVLIKPKWRLAIRKTLSKAEIADIFLALLDDRATGHHDTLSTRAAPIFEMLKIESDDYAESYLKRCEVNQKNAKKRWQNPNANECDGIQPNANDANDANKIKLNEMKLNEMKLNKNNQELKNETRKPKKKNAFHNFDQRVYDFNELEKKLIDRGNQLTEVDYDGLIPAETVTTAN